MSEAVVSMWLNGVSMDPSDELPEPWPCEMCGRPVWVGRLTADLGVDKRCVPRLWMAA
jgi:hypothetical protein